MKNDKITDHVRLICKIGEGEKCCKYLVMGTEGFECMKADKESKKIVDDNWAVTSHVSQGDNCTGVKNFNILNKKLENTL